MNLPFHDVLARQGFSFCNSVLLNFQAFALRGMKVAARKGCCVGQKMSDQFNFCRLKCGCIEEAFISMFQISRATISRFNSKTQ